MSEKPLLEDPAGEKATAVSGEKHSSVVNNPLHGVTLKTVVTELHERYGWEELGRRVPLMCFTNNPTLGSSLKFLRQTPWAREKVERLYLKSTRSPDSSGDSPKASVGDAKAPEGGDVWQAWNSKAAATSNGDQQDGEGASDESGK